MIGTVGRIQDVKNHGGLVDAFIDLRALLPDQRDRLRLAIVGDGPLLRRIQATRCTRPACRTWYGCPARAPMSPS